MSEKQCIACKQSINEKALKCYWCRQIQTPIANLQNRPISTYIGLMAFFAFLAWVFYQIYTSPFQQEYQDNLQASEFKISLSEKNDLTWVACFADIKNKSEWRWGGMSLVAKFYSETGQIIDIQTAEYPDLKIYPSKSATLKVAGEAVANKDDYYRCRVDVVDAE